MSLSTIIDAIVQQFDKRNRNWREATWAFDKFAATISPTDFYNHLDDIKRLLESKMNGLFTTAQRQTYPAPNIDKYVENAIRNIRKRY